MILENSSKKNLTGDNIIYLYDNNLSKSIYVLNDLIKIEEEDKEHDLFKIKFKTSEDISNNTNNLSKIKIFNRDKTIFHKYINRTDINKSYYGNNVNIKKILIYMIIK